MKEWFSDRLFRTILRNAGYLGSTKLLGAGLGLLALAAAGHALRPETFGALMIVHSYATGVGALVKFQSWQAILKYGAPALARGGIGARETRDAIRFAFGLDLASGLVGLVAAIAALPFLAGWFQLPRDSMGLALVYCTLVPTMSAATPTGVLRLLDRFDLIAAQQLATPALRAAGAVSVWLGGGGFVGFVVTWYVADLAGDLILWLLAVRELRRRGLLDALRPSLFAAARRLPGAWGFAWTTNLSISLDAAWGPVGNLVVAGVLGPAAAGLYKIAATLLDSAGKPANLLTRGFYPEIMRLDPSGKRPWRLGLRIGLLSGGIGLLLVAIVLLGGKPLIAFAFGRRYGEAFGVLRLMVVALVIAMASFPLESLLYMVGRQRIALIAQAGGALVYLAALAALSTAFGLPGAGLAYILGTIALAVFRLLPTLSGYRERARHAWAPA